MAEPKSASKPRKIIDVTEPGKSAPSASGKPIIVTNRPMLKQDPMVVTPPSGDAVTPAADGSATSRVAKSLSPLATAAKEETPTSKPKPIGVPIKTLMSSTATEEKMPTAKPAPPAAPNDKETPAGPPETAAMTAPKVKPPFEPPKPTTPTPEVLPDKPEAGAGPDKPATPAAGQTYQPAAPTDKPEPPAEPPAPEAAGNTDETQTADNQLAPNQVVDEAKKKIDEQKAATLAEQEKIIASKKYYLPIKSASSGRENRQALLLLLFVTLAAAVWLDISLDAGIVALGGLHAVTHFFH